MVVNNFNQVHRRRVCKLGCRKHEGPRSRISHLSLCSELVSAGMRPGADGRAYPIEVGMQQREFFNFTPALASLTLRLSPEDLRMYWHLRGSLDLSRGRPLKDEIVAAVEKHFSGRSEGDKAKMVHLLDEQTLTGWRDYVTARKRHGVSYFGIQPGEVLAMDPTFLRFRERRTGEIYASVSFVHLGTGESGQLFTGLKIYQKLKRGRREPGDVIDAEADDTRELLPEDQKPEENTDKSIVAGSASWAVSFANEVLGKHLASPRPSLTTDNISPERK